MQSVETLAAEYDMLPLGEVILCAVSGGADSMCLLHYLKEGGHAVHAAHYNHHLRPGGADADAAFVAARCRDWDIPFHLGEGDVAGAGGNVEEAARQMRYAFLEETAQKIGATRIATAHNADDNLETILLHLTRGCGLEGLTGIPPRRGNIVRPLLTTGRGEIEDYLARHQIDHVEDATNADPAYARNRIRHQVAPVLRSLNPKLTKTVSDMSRRLRADNDFLNAQAAAAVAAGRWAEDDLVVDTGLLASLPTAVAIRAVKGLIERMGDGRRALSAHLDSVVALARGDDPSAVVFLPDGLLVQRVYGDLLFTTQTDPETFSPVPLVPGENAIPNTGWTVTVRETWPGLAARPRQTGDSLRLPNRDTKTIKKLFIDEKIPRRDRDLIPVVADGDGVVAVAGFGPNTDHPRYKPNCFTFKREDEEQ